jgi:hypothetical protein
LIEETMEIDELPENDERLLKKPEIKRDEMGRFEQAGTGLIKKAQKKGKVGSNLTQYQPGHDRPGPGRPKGSKNKTTLALREAILAALDSVGGPEYLAKLAIENSSAFASLLKSVLPTTLEASDSDGGGPTTIQFCRVIVMPDGSRHIEGKTPRQLPPPASHTLPNDEPIALDHKENNDLEG